MDAYFDLEVYTFNENCYYFCLFFYYLILDFYK